MSVEKLNPKDIPADFPVRPLSFGALGGGIATCFACGLSWDDAVVTSLTPAPAGRCPFEQFHGGKVMSEGSASLVDLMFTRAGYLRGQGEQDRAADLVEYASQMQVLIEHPPMATASLTLKEVLQSLVEYARKAAEIA